MATSTIPTLKANLVTQLQARPNLANVQVSYGPPLPNPRREYIWVGDVVGDQDYFTMATPNQRREQYEVEIVIGVLREGTRTQLADERCFVLLGEVETQLRGDNTVNNAVNEAHLSMLRLTEYVGADSKHRFAQLITQVACQAWI